MNLFGSLNGLVNVLESGDIQGLRPNTAQTNTLYESQWCDDVARVEHVDSNFLYSEYDDRADQAANETNSCERDHSCNTGNVTACGKHMEEV